MSIRENELRVGVYILYCEKVFQVDAECINMHWGDDLDDAYRPIPLTKEWLLMFGFEKQIDDYYYFYGYYASFDADLPMWFGQEGCCQKETIKENIKYVHQLQNLWFALTGEELTIAV
jgi:hypothetical protein